MRSFLRISNYLLDKEEDLIKSLFTWLRREENAVVDKVEIDTATTTFYFTGGIEIRDKEQFDVECTRIVENVYSFRIV